MKIRVWYGVDCGQKEGPLAAELIKLHDDGTATVRITDENHLSWCDQDPFEYRASRLRVNDPHHYEVLGDDYAWEPVTDV